MKADHVDIDWSGFLKRNGLTKAEMARLLGAAPAMVTGWMKGKNQPGHKYLGRLCMIGMTAYEMFVDQIGKELVDNSLASRAFPDVYGSEGFKKGVAMAIAEIEKNRDGQKAGGDD